MEMPMEQLKDEYKAAVACSNCFYGVSEELVFSGLHEYIDAWLDVIRMVISERVCNSPVSAYLLPALAGAVGAS